MEHVRELHGECVHRGGDLALQQDHGGELDRGLRGAERLAERVDLRGVERGEHDDRVHVGRRPPPALGSAPVQDDGPEIRPERRPRHLDQIGQHPVDGLWKLRLRQ